MPRRNPAKPTVIILSERSPDEPISLNEHPAMPSVDELTPEAPWTLAPLRHGSSSFTESSSATTNSTGNIFDERRPPAASLRSARRSGTTPFFRSKRSTASRSLRAPGQVRCARPQGFSRALETPAPSSSRAARTSGPPVAEPPEAGSGLATTWTCWARALGGARPRR